LEFNSNFVGLSKIGMRGTGYGIRDTGYGIRDTGYGIRGAGYGMRLGDWMIWEEREGSFYRRAQRAKLRTVHEGFGGLAFAWLGGRKWS